MYKFPGNRIECLFKVYRSFLSLARPFTILTPTTDAMILSYFYMSRIMKNPDFCMRKNAHISCAAATHFISAFIFDIRRLWLLRSVCVRIGRKPKRQVLSRRVPLSFLFCWTPTTAPFPSPKMIVIFLFYFMFYFRLFPNSQQ